MKRLILVSFVLISVFLSVMSAEGKTGFIEFFSTYYSFGTFPKNKVRKVVFPFKNTGSSSVLLYSVEPSCGCTSVVFTKKPIPPGKIGYVDVYFNPTQTTTGHFKKSIDVRSNASNSIVRLFIEGTTI